MIIDYLSVTMTEESHAAVIEEITPILAHIGVVSAFQGVYKLSSGGALKTGPTRGSVYHVSASGDMLSALRAENLYQNYLSVLSEVPHRITRMDVALDVHCDAPKALKRLTKRAYAGDIKLTRNRVDPRTQVQKVLGLNREGRETGTLYLGPKKPQIAKCRVYDKRQERWNRVGLDIPPTLRYELQLGRKSNCSLRDAWEPDPVFWHFMQDLLPAPSGVPEWVPYGEGFKLPPSVALLPAEALKRLLESSDVTDRLLSLSDRIGPQGFEYLVRLLRNKHESKTIRNAESEETAIRA